MSRTVLWPLLVLALGTIVGLDRFVLQTSWLGGSAPSAMAAEDGDEALVVTRTTLSFEGIALRVRAGGNEPVRISQVQIDAAYWQFQLEPAGPLLPGEEAWLRIPYPWVLNETHHVVMLTPDGTVFEHTIAGARVSLAASQLPPF